MPTRVNSPGPTFIVWEHGLQPQGPMDLPAMISWVKADRIKAATWIFIVKTGEWVRALDVPELQLFFWAGAGRTPGDFAPTGKPNVDHRLLRRHKLLVGLTDEQLERFCRFVTIEKIPQRAIVVKQGDKGDAMYLILEGELAVCINVDGKQKMIAHLGVGEFFGDISLLDHGPRSADVIACTATTVLKVCTTAFGKMSKEAPELAMPFLMAIGRTLTARIRAANKRYADSLKFAEAVE